MIKRTKKSICRTLKGTLGASLLANLLTGKGTIRASEETIRAG